ncbi:MAG TPA: EAL domain-containing protein [Vicinamibacteria bacterium]|nr:EAL domain-containing protein [Vicinamibacteria bacterium]
MEKTSRETRTSPWCLESKLEGGRVLQRVAIHSFPFRIGRIAGLDLTLPFQSVSKRHAEIYMDGEDLMLRDLDSTNGTFVNRQRVTGSLLREGDILHFAEFEFRLGRVEGEGLVRRADQTLEFGTLAISRMVLSQQFVSGTRQLAELMDQRLVTAAFQAIVSIPEGKVIGYEVLGRGLHPELPENPCDLFRIAETLGREAELSRLFRQQAIELVLSSGLTLPRLFLNTHPIELGRPELIESLRQVRIRAPEQELALEIHEGALAKPHVTAELKRELDALNISLALDDFGLGERFAQLAEVEPHYLKFDMSWFEDLLEARASKRRLLSMLMAAARELHAEPIAEGIESRREAEVCAEMGFRLAQGYLYSEPRMLDDLSEEPSQKVQCEGHKYR